AAFVLTGLLMIEGAFGIFQQQDELSRSARRLGAVLLVLPGLGAVIDGFFTFEHFLPHFVGFALALTTMVSFPIVGVMLRRTWDWRTVGTGLVIAGPLTLALAVLYFATFTPTVAGIQTGVAGLTERALVLEIQAWYVVLGWLTYRRALPSRELVFNSFQIGD
ncbi:MAG TPA: DUF998 domain-containing protein, partial [Candidatus Dormibacteraeota bacterium]|nr:DUF998 domain-containing protein [Candidatus Dormibacteraeota bacterium]